MCSMSLSKMFPFMTRIILSFTLIILLINSILLLLHVHVQETKCRLHPTRSAPAVLNIYDISCDSYMCVEVDQSKGVLMSELTGKRLFLILGVLVLRAEGQTDCGRMVEVISNGYSERFL